jgi:hypothetical protein
MVDVAMVQNIGDRRAQQAAPDGGARWLGWQKNKEP